MLYVTQNGTWGGTKAEMPALCREDGSPRGGWKAVPTPKSKAAHIRLLNSLGARPEPEVEQKPKAEVVPQNGARFRVYAKTASNETIFVSSAYAKSHREAVEKVAGTLIAAVTGG